MSSRKKDTGPSQRQLRVGEALRHSLAELLLRVEINDDRLKGIYLTVSEVRASPDLRHVTAYVSPLEDANSDPSRKANIIDALNRHARFLRGELSPKVTLKYMPELKFALDSSYDEYEKIDALLKSPRVAQDLERNQKSGEELSDPSNDKTKT